MSGKEATARIKINKLLEAADWRFFLEGNAPKQVKLPLPPLFTQQQIVAEIEAEQAIVVANRELTKRFEKKI